MLLDLLTTSIAKLRQIARVPLAQVASHGLFGNVTRALVELAKIRFGLLFFVRLAFDALILVACRLVNALLRQL